MAYGTGLPFRTIKDCNYIQCNKNKIHSFDPHGKPNTRNVSWEQKLSNCDIDKNNIACYQQILILSGHITGFMQGCYKHMKYDNVSLNILG